MLAVTTFPPWAWDIYAKKCIDTWVKFWPGSVLVYFEGTAPPAPAVPGIEFRPLDDIEERRDFLNREYTAPHPSYLFDVKRFCHKVFAQLDAAEEHEQFWWVDADVEMKEPMPDERVQSLTNHSFASFLGRDTYTETGVIAFNQMDEDSERFWDRYRACYTLGLIFKQRFWTDCHAFDFAREGGGYNMTPHGTGVENVMKTSPIGKWMKHHKGNLKLKLEEQ